ncbi:MAG: hypothetical protein ACRYGR_06200 [Janthinobacterium lividum]
MIKYGFLLTSLFINIYSINASNNSNQVLTIDQFQKAIEGNKFLKEIKQNGPLTDMEKKLIINAIKYKDMSFGGTFDVNREIDKFQGDILVVGGGKMGGYRMPGRLDAITDLKEEFEQLKHLESVQSKNSSLEREENIKKIQDKINKNLNKYYTINIDKNTKPDILASISSISDMSHIPNNKFSEVYFEKVDCAPFLHPNTYKILSRIVKPNGKIHLETGGPCKRMLIIATENTKWGDQVKGQLKNSQADMVDIKLQN